LQEFPDSHGPSHQQLCDAPSETDAMLTAIASSPRHCPVCRSHDSRRLWSAEDPHYGVPGQWWIRECRACGSYFLEDLLSAEEMARLYAPTYYAYDVPRPSLRTLLRRVLVGPATHEPRLAVTGRLLDFGCGAGEFLLRMRGRGWDAAGVEISDVARSRAHERGLDVRSRISGAEGFPPASFDYVRANHSLEHVAAPENVLHELFGVLKPGGTLFVGVPTTTSQNARVFGRSWWHLAPPLHTFVPSKRGIVALIERAGFEVQKTTTHGDFAGTAGSLQIRLNRGTARRSNQGILFRAPPLLLVGHWIARLQNAFGIGDVLELVARRPV
jgi:SAM-dependent methyltransferase